MFFGEDNYGFKLNYYKERSMTGSNKDAVKHTSISSTKALNQASFKINQSVASVPTNFFTPFKSKLITGIPLLH